MCQIGCRQEDHFGDCTYKKRGKFDLYPCEWGRISKIQDKKEENIKQPKH